MNLQEKQDILTTAVEGGIGYWATITDYDRGPDGTWWRVTLAPTGEPDEFEATTVYARDLGTAADVLLEKYPRCASATALRAAKKERDMGYLDAEAADMLVQIAAFGEVVYG